MDHRTKKLNTMNKAWNSKDDIDFMCQERRKKIGKNSFKKPYKITSVCFVVTEMKQITAHLVNVAN